MLPSEVPGAWCRFVPSGPSLSLGEGTSTSPALVLVCSLETVPERGGVFFLCVGVLQAVSAQLSSAWQGVSPVERAGRHVGSKLTHKEDYDFYSGEIKEEKPLSGTVAVVSAVHSVCAC